MTEISLDIVNAVGDAFNANDIDAVMQFFAEDAIFDHAAGSENCGTRFTGSSTIRGVFAGLFDRVENVHWETLDCRIVGNKAYCEYLRRATDKDGNKEEYNSVDILTFKGGLITHKDTYYKQKTG